MTKEFKVKKFKDATVYTLESATSGGTSAGAVASVSSPMGGVRRRDNLIAQEGDSIKVPVAQKPRQGALKTQTGAGAHRDKKKEMKQGKEKHKKPFAEGIGDVMSTLDAVFNEHDFYRLERIWPALEVGDKEEALRQINHYLRKGKNRAWWGDLQAVDIKVDPSDVENSKVLWNKPVDQNTDEGILDFFKKTKRNPANFEEYMVYDTFTIFYDPTDETFIVKGTGEWADKLPTKEFPANSAMGGLSTAQSYGEYRTGGIKEPIKINRGVINRGAHEGLEDPKDNPCWKGYKPVGTKKKAGKTVPNCVPKEDMSEDHEVQMASNELKSIHANAKRLLALVQQYGEQGDLEAWQQSKITKAADYLNSVLQSIGGEQDALDDVDEDHSTVGGWGKGSYDTYSGTRHGRGVAEDEYFAHLENMLNEDWQKVNKKDKTDGMSRKAVKAYRRENPGSKLKTAVTTKPSKLKKGGKAANRRKSFCARMSGNKGPMKDEKGRPTPKAKALSRWNCEEDVYMNSLSKQVAEKLNPQAPVDTWVQDFQKADPNKYHQFKNKTPQKKAQMAVAARYAANEPSKKK